jgi:UDP-N-acetylmuramoyl-L-alanyl-D-glutamate--2,6-diaminopimelate ligase
VNLESLLKGIPGVRVRGNPAAEISGLACDSRKAAPGDLFFALPGERADGREFIGEAVKRGAHAVARSEGGPDSVAVPVVEASDIRKSMAHIAARFFEEPSRELVLIGVTGTNGKTSFTYLMESILQEAGLKPGVIGTVSYRYGDHVHHPANTTPESLDLQRMLRDMVKSGVTHALLEVSSHGLDAHRVEACHFSRAAFTMLGRDHLDHHGNMEAYFASKAGLFTDLLARSAMQDRKAVVNQDDPYGRRLLGMIHHVPAVTVGRRQEADYRLESAVCGRDGTSLEIRRARKVFRLRSPLLAEVNAMNVLLAVAVADGIGIEDGAIARGVERTGRIPGRLDRITTDRGFLVLVDYAHTPEALDRMLAGVRGFTPGRLITVFGCGGDRDRGKRPLMGKAAARWSDLVLVTSDNPRSEPPEAIIEEILAGMREEGIRFMEPAEIAGRRTGARAFSRVVDRREAIGLAVRIAEEGDTLVIAGKGHEEVQIVGRQKIPFRDGEEVVRALRGIGDRESAIG